MNTPAAGADAFTTRFDGPAPEVAVSKDMIKRGLIAAPALIAGSARISLGLMMGAVLFGYLIRLGLIFLAVWLVKDTAWISFPALGSTIIITHLGLLFWEMKFVALSLAAPGLKPTGSNMRPDRI